MADLLGRANENAQELDRLRRFVQIEVPAHYNVSTSASIFFVHTQWLSARIALEIASIGDTGTRRSNCAEFDFAVEDVAIVQACHVIVSCPTLTCLDISGFGPVGLAPDAFLTQVFSVLRTSHSLSHLILFTVLQSRVEAIIARFLSGNTRLTSCTTMVGYRIGEYPRDVGGLVHPLWTPLVPFTTTVPSEANLGIERLVLNAMGLNFGWKDCELDAVVDLVARSTTLEILEVGPSICERRNKIQYGMGRALECNRTLKELRFSMHSVADFEQLVVLLVPDADGHQTNTTLSTLELYLDSFYASPLDFMTDLAKLVAFNTTLTNVRISRKLGFRIWEKMEEVRKLGGELERMVDNELQRNTSLRSLSVAEWEVHRRYSTQERQRMVNNVLQRYTSLLSLSGEEWKVHRRHSAHEWQMTYSGPCMARKLGEPHAEHYEVKIKVR